MKQITAITFEWEPADDATPGAWIVRAPNTGLIAEGGTLERAVMMFKDAAQLMGYDVPVGPNKAIEPPDNP